jgi:molybdopterin-dependent oxidoreductase alpha subunit
MRRLTSGGGWAAISYTLRMARRVGWRQLWRALNTRNACKTCALGMGGQAGGMRNELGHWPEVCKKSLQAMVADMQQGLRPEFFERFSIAELQRLSPRELEWCGRLVAPLYSGPGDTHYRVVSWDEAFDRLVEQFRQQTPDETFFYASGRSSNEAGFLLQLFARLLGTNFVNNCSYYCHQASGVGLTSALGTGTATVTLEDVEQADLFVLLGGNPASNHPRLMRTLMSLRRRGGQVIVINPVKELGLVNFSVPSDVRSLLFGSPIASLYLQPHIGGDIPLLMGMSKVLLERGLVTQEFIAHSTEGFEDFAHGVAETSWQAITTASGVEQADIVRAADLYARSRRTVFGWTMGITHHEHGVDNVRAIVNLALLRGMVGQPGAGLLPIRGHSNVQGMGSVGVTPQLKQEIIDRLESLLQVQLPRSPGLDTMACMQAAGRGELKSALCLGGNLFGSNPDARFAQQALAKLQLVAYLSTSLNSGHAWGRGQATLILPVLARDEEPEPTTQESMFSFVRLSDGGKERLRGPRSEIEIIATLAERVLGPSSPLDWSAFRKHRRVQEVIAKVIPGYQALSDIIATRQEFHIPGRRLSTAKFPTASGRARFKGVAIPRHAGAVEQLRLMTVRSEGQFNTVVYEEEDIYRGQDRRNVILMNSHDIARLGLHVDQEVTVRSAVGVMHGIRVRAFDIRAGNALMYYPEANVLVPTTTDPESRTPAFKNVLVEVVAQVPSRNPGNGVDPSGKRVPLTMSPG